MNIDIIFYIILVLILLFIGYIIGTKIQKWKDISELKEKLPDIRKDAISQSRAVLTGQFSEQIAPYLPDFQYKPTEARFIGKPIDFIIFKGLDEKNVKEVVFVEVKSGQSQLSKTQNILKETIQNKKVSWDEYIVPSSKKHL